MARGLPYVNKTSVRVVSSNNLHKECKTASHFVLNNYFLHTKQKEGALFYISSQTKIMSGI